MFPQKAQLFYHLQHRRKKSCICTISLSAFLVRKFSFIYKISIFWRVSKWCMEREGKIKLFKKRKLTPITGQSFLIMAHGKTGSENSFFLWRQKRSNRRIKLKRCGAYRLQRREKG